MSDLPAILPQESWFFRYFGLIACALTGNLNKYRALRGQALLETGSFTSKAWRSGGGAWCMHFSVTSTPRASGVYTTSNGEPVAVYTGPFRFWKMWMDRLRWDQRHGIGADLPDLNTYIGLVINAGWLGTNPTGDRISTYTLGWKACYNKVPKGLLGGDFGEALGTRIAKWSMLLLLTVIIVILLFYAVRWCWHQCKRMKR